MKTLSVVIPAYNEESGIAEIVHRVLDVDDGLREEHVELLEVLKEMGIDDANDSKTDLVRVNRGSDKS